MSLNRNEIKTFKVENYGTFFLQKLQNFFNKTDYCDLTLQFNDNSQLKVHRLVLSACTDYFNILEQSYDTTDDLLVMPDHLQADVIVPIVNFMYTGTFEFQFSMYEKLLRTAREMNMTVLSKLLEAHRQPQVVKQSQPILLNKNAPSNRVSTQIVRKPMPRVKTLPDVVYKHHQTTIKPVSPQKNIPEPIQIVTKYNQESAKSRPSRFIVPDNVVPDTDQTFDNISYESKPLSTASELKREDENSPFESLRKGYTNKRIASPGSASAPPTKKLNLEEVREMTEAQRLRTELADDDDDDPDYDGDTNFNEDDFEDDGTQNTSDASQKQKITRQITVKDDGGNVNHAKIISEVLKKYPHLVKNHKNIKLKIMQRPSASNSKQTTAIVQAIKQEKSSTKMVTSTPQAGGKPATATPPKRIDAKTMHALIAKGAENMSGPWLCLRCGVNGRPISIPSYKSFRKHLVNVHNEKIDPRICEHCGYKVSTRFEMHGHLFSEHQIDPPAGIKITATAAPAPAAKKLEQQCIYCDATFTKEFLLFAHMRSTHRHKAKSDGVIDFGEEDYVPNMDSSDSASSKDNNKIKIISNIAVPPNSFELDGATLISQPSSEAEALSNVATGIATSLGLAADDNYIETQLAQVHGEFVKKEDLSAGSDVLTKLITEDGTELSLTPSQKEEILAQLQNQGADLGENVVMVLDQSQFAAATAGADQSNMVVMYAQGDEFLQQSTDTDTVQTTESAAAQITSEDLENAEIVFQTGESGNVEAAEKKDETAEEKQVKEEEEDKKEVKSEENENKDATKSEDSTKKLKNLLDDWSEDEDGAEKEGKEEKEEEEEEENEDVEMKSVNESKEEEEIEKEEEKEEEAPIPAIPAEDEVKEKKADEDEEKKEEIKEEEVEVKERTVEEEMQYVFGDSGDDEPLPASAPTDEKDVMSVIDELKSEVVDEKPVEDEDKVPNEEEIQIEEAEVEEEDEEEVEEEEETAETEEVEPTAADTIVVEEKSAIDTDDASKDEKSSEINSLLNEWSDL